MLSSIRSGAASSCLGESSYRAHSDRLEFGTINGAPRRQQIKLAAQRHEGTADVTNGLAVVLAEVRNWS